MAHFKANVFAVRLGPEFGREWYIEANSHREAEAKLHKAVLRLSENHKNTFDYTNLVML